MGIIASLVVGAIAGWVAGKLMRGQGYGLIGNIIVGIIGALVGGWLGSLLFPGVDFIRGFDIRTILTSIVGAVIVVGVWGLVTRGRVTG